MKKSLLAACLLLSFTSCEQLYEVIPKPQPMPKPTAAELLLAGTTSKTWIQTDLRYNGAYGAFDRLRSCERDNELVFLADKRLEVNEGATKCFENNPDRIESGTWKINGKQLEHQSTKTEFSMLGAPSVLIDELTETKLTVSYEGTGTRITRYFRAK